MDLTCDEELSPASNSPGGAQDRAQAAGAFVAEDVTLRQRIPDSYLARPDPAILNDPRVLPNMLKAEEINLPSCSYFKVLQSDITPEMRRAVATWMFEVCEEERLPENVFLRGVNYMDRFLTTDKIKHNQFQLLGAVCLLISSKWSGQTLSVAHLSSYTADSCTTKMLLEWELMVLARLKWDTFFITPADFVDHILPKLKGTLWTTEDIKEKTTTYTAYCATDDKFAIYPPSMIASAAITAAIGNQVSRSVLQEVMSSLHEITNIETDVLTSCVEQLRAKITEMVTGNFQSPGAQNPGVSRRDRDVTDVSTKLMDLDQAETPTDVHEINF